MMLFKMFKKGVWIIGIVLFTAILLAPPGNAAPQAVKLKFASMSVGGNWYIYASTMAAIMQKYLPEGSSIDVSPESGGVGNPMMVSNNQAQLAISFGPVQSWAWNGTVAYAERKKKFQGIRALIGGINEPAIHKNAIMAQASLGIKSLQEVKDKKMKLRVVTDRTAALGGYVSEIICRQYGFTFDDITSWGGNVTRLTRDQAIPLIQDRRADLALYVVGQRQPDVVELAMNADIKFLPISAEIQKTLMKEYGFSATNVHKDEFKGVDTEVRTIGLPTGVIVNKDLPDEIVYLMMKALAENVKDIQAAHSSVRHFDPSKGWEPSLNGNVPLHPGAAKFYKEKGWMK